MAQRQVSQRVAGHNLQALVADLNRVLEEHAFAINEIIKDGTGYTVQNITPDKDFDADATTTAELADVLGTLIAELQSKGIIS